MAENNTVRLALNICTYKRPEQLKRNLDMLLSSHFFNNPEETDYYGKLEIFVTDNASEIEAIRGIHLFHNQNTGGSGGFQRGIEEIRKYDRSVTDSDHITNVIFMDDDVSFEMDAFYILFDFLKNVDKENADRPVAGRMFDKDNPDIQWTAAEKWNGGNIEHVEFLRDITDSLNPYIKGKAILDTGADYGGFWFCCYPMDYVRKNDILPFFIHCDDVEYGLRCGKSPMIIEGVHVWHETWDKKMSPTMLYYDTRNTLFVNRMYGWLPDRPELMRRWKAKITEYHNKNDLLSEYMVIRAMGDFLKGFKWLERTDGCRLNRKLVKTNTCRFKNAFLWRFVMLKAALSA